MSAGVTLQRVLDRAARALAAPPLDDNVDPERFPHGMPEVTPAQTEQRREHLISHAAEWEWLARTLDEPGRVLLEALLAFHLLGHQHARVGPSAAEVTALLAEANDTLIVERDVTRISYAGSGTTHVFALSPLGYDVTLESYMLGVQGTFQLQQYRSPTAPAARPAAGDIAIDAGGCFGETAFWLAHQVGATGHVQTLEFAPENLAILRANVERNPELGQRIALTEAALWHAAGVPVAVARGGPASMITPGAAADPAPETPATVRTVSLDELVSDASLPRVDFLKLDIEGAEPAALRGGTESLQRWRPKLAMATYHDIDHLWQLPRYVADLGLGYRFALGHFTMHAEETVIYGWVP